ncbi:GNAT superfamily N-acetyltransferase [Pullulanibacillus pueri]|uniref:N-acetyltransferase domain-containing protein n=1 Tax=Pullulanibacillus pueri TaxID=1437324 RepID=A0A8J2ZVM4_9BACL|nr:GNAT family N-acetyltransferase [Pullulanibacillus pueri]MBM7682319.1 GNAT superfamily N-acetyltransferase [Pullulanibacillus pueri]GGH80810.1 hypothetical protein GCM10007096_17770 [Pullulanibacillus pueri]
MNHNKILEAIEAQHWDVEDTFVPEGIAFVDNEQLMMIRNHQSTSIYANKIVKFRHIKDIVKGIEEVYRFYEAQAFAWWIGPQEPPELLDYLLSNGWYCIDQYEGLALSLEDWEPQRIRHQVREVLTDKEIRELISVSAEVWDYDLPSRKAAFKERKMYIRLPERRGHYFIAYSIKGIPVAYGNDRLSADGSVLYLKGSATLKNYRNQGYYSDLVRFRLNLAKQMGAQWATVQARIGTSEPILKTLGFKGYGLYRHLVRK